VRFTPSEAVDLLKERAPAAVKDYLEHLVFGKNQNQYANDLIYFYLDTVTEAIADPSTSAGDILLTSYHTYRALSPPKPTYSQFIHDNSLPDTWWQNRLRLLQLIGGSSVYDVEALSNRLEPYSEVLVPEMIVLAARRDEHQKALKLLVHGLADFDTVLSPWRQQYLPPCLIFLVHDTLAYQRRTRTPFLISPALLLRPLRPHPTTRKSSRTAREIRKLVRRCRSIAFTSSFMATGTLWSVHR
jgi:hypothetical protein